MDDHARHIPPPDPDAASWWEYREIAEMRIESAQHLDHQARQEKDPDEAARLVGRAQLQVLTALYHQLRAIGDHQEVLAQQQQQLAKRLSDHAQALADHAGGMADHRAALGSHVQAMAEMTKAIASHGEDLRHALQGWSR
ncbi:hypothetical protein [Streptoalloteichus hindustanus]|uniref:Uncharacterized protein n=1 Tax=Streptoalloteichus hindustanus TaxID=2017 RepID=A0A1M5M7Z0_STRHI|nr:hypothetical protein [Streptoalloteichus hindustanus]SHG73387.1 hypothetical protein SAMN05444320_11324 [Streptoalloteichus hindustanus]